jgi:hypothetical protein
LDTYVPISLLIPNRNVLNIEHALQKTPSTCQASAPSPAPALRLNIMPKIISYTPPWLCRPSSGSQAFTYDPRHDSDASKHSSPLRSLHRGSVDQTYYGPHRLLARRGTEVFVVVGNQIRWTDLRTIKNDWEEQMYHSATWSKSMEQQDVGELSSYRVRWNYYLPFLHGADLIRF